MDGVRSIQFQVAPAHTQEVEEELARALVDLKDDLEDFIEDEIEEVWTEWTGG